MSTVGIIAEYNPFHNGHMLHLNRAKELTGADHALSVMSGNFLQRGLPAFCDKYSRAFLAVSCGLDAVFELPFIYAVSGAGEFAAAGISLLDNLGAVDYVAFGAEDNVPELFEEISQLLAEEPEEYSLRLRSLLKGGHSYASARAAALSEILGDTCADIINKPNNILAIEYCTALKKTGSHIKPMIITRKYSDYNSTELNPAISSASAINRAIYDTGSYNNIKGNVPEAVYSFIADNFNRKLPIYHDDMSQLLQHRRLFSDITDPASNPNSRKYGSINPDGNLSDKKYGSINPDGNLSSKYTGTEIYDMSTELENRLRKLPLNDTISNVAGTLKTRNYTYTRVCRALVHYIFGVTGEEFQREKADGYIRYARLLSFRRDSGALLREIKNKATAPVITKMADTAPEILDSVQMKYDLMATNIYNNMVYNKFGEILPNDFTANIPIF